MKVKNKKDILKGLWKLSMYINNEDCLDEVLTYGVADGDNLDSEDDMYFYVSEDEEDDDDFFEMINMYVRVLSLARRNGGFYDPDTRTVF